MQCHVRSKARTCTPLRPQAAARPWLSYCQVSILLHLSLPHPMCQQPIPHGNNRRSSYAGILISLKEEAGRKQHGPTVVVLCPTRELAAQSHRALKLLLPHSSLRGSLLTKATVAGTDFARVDILIATPLLLVQTIQASKVRLLLVLSCSRAAAPGTRTVRTGEGPQQLQPLQPPSCAQLHPLCCTEAKVAPGAV